MLLPARCPGWPKVDCFTPSGAIEGMFQGSHQTAQTSRAREPRAAATAAAAEAEAAEVGAAGTEVLEGAVVGYFTATQRHGTG